MKDKLNLHDAMEIILREQPKNTASTDFLSNEIYKRGLYLKKDNGKAEPHQMFLRAKNYPHLFDLIDRNTIRLKTNENQDIESFSWKIMGDIAIKKLDKSAFLHHGTGIPIEIRDFFNVQSLKIGSSLDVQLYNDEMSYPAKIEMTKTPRTRLMWKADFSKLLKSKFPEHHKAYESDNNPPYTTPELFLKKIDSTNYSVSFISPQNPAVEAELQYRLNIWLQLKAQGDPQNIKPSVLRDLKIYGGAQGIWVNKERTKEINETGVTVSLLHTGSSYADDLSNDGVLYHYPSTNRPSGRDMAEIEATKAAGQLGLPVFVITYPHPNSTLRNVHLGWVENWDDKNKIFLITFDEQPPGYTPQEKDKTDELPFQLTDKGNKSKREVASRKGQQRFKFQVFKRYGPRCAVCGIKLPELLDAAHIKPKNENGSDDPRNGLVLCALHHRALDAGFYAIEPNTLKIYFRKAGPTAKVLKITCFSIKHLKNKPHIDALKWLWGKWSE